MTDIEEYLNSRKYLSLTQKQIANELFVGNDTMTFAKKREKLEKFIDSIQFISPNEPIIQYGVNRVMD